MSASVWIKRLKCLILVTIFASVGNYISTSKAGAPVTPLEAAPGLLMLLAATLVGCILYELVNKVSSKNLPVIAYVSLIAIIITIPGVFPFADYCIESIGKIGLLPLCTPILAYAGISIGKDLDTFKQQGVSIVIISLFAFIGTYIGSAIIAEVILRVAGVI